MPTVGKGKKTKATTTTLLIRNHDFMRADAPTLQTVLGVAN